VDEIRERGWIIDVTETLRDDELSFKLTQGATCDHQEANEILGAYSTSAFCNVARIETAARLIWLVSPQEPCTPQVLRLLLEFRQESLWFRDTPAPPDQSLAAKL
jgi:hypothetical protein